MRGPQTSSPMCMVVGGALCGLSHPLGGCPGLLTRWQCSKKAGAEAAKPLGSLDLTVALLQAAFAGSEWGNPPAPQPRPAAGGCAYRDARNACVHFCK